MTLSFQFPSFQLLGLGNAATGTLSGMFCRGTLRFELGEFGDFPLEVLKPWFTWLRAHSSAVLVIGREVISRIAGVQVMVQSCAILALYESDLESYMRATFWHFPQQC